MNRIVKELTEKEKKVKGVRDRALIKPNMHVPLHSIFHLNEIQLEK